MAQIGPMGYVQPMYSLYSADKINGTLAQPGLVAVPPQAILSNAQQGVYGGIQNHGMQRYLPISEKRPFLPEEEVAIQKGLRQW